MVLRLVTGVAAGSLAFLAAWSGPYWWLGFVVLLLGTASIEWAQMGGISETLTLIVLLLAMAMVVLQLWGLIPILLIFPSIPLLYYQDPERGRDAVWSVAGIIWLAVPAGLIFYVRKSFGFDALAVLMLGTILQDSLAYYSGYLLGGDRPFTPELSPNKTWAGFFGGLFGMILIVVLGGQYMDWPVIVTLPAGIALGLIGQAGDLTISSLKRLTEIDDTGSVFPGHGGILDRTDALIFNVVLFFPLCHFVETYDFSLSIFLLQSFPG